MSSVHLIFVFLRSVLRNQAELAAENLALRQQLAILKQKTKLPRLRPRDRDGIYGAYFRSRVKHMGMEEIVTARRSPWQNPFVERLIGSIRCECLNHVIILNERHLQRILRSYFDYYHQSRTHLSLDRNSPIEREVDPPKNGKVIAIPQVGGLHHRYCRAAWIKIDDSLASQNVGLVCAHGAR